MKQGTQRSMYCRCGREKILANGHCATCYTLRRQDERHFGGLRERVLERDSYYCRACGASGRDKRSIVVHHRRPGRSKLDLMISLCPACHAKIHRTQTVLSEMRPLLLALWRELHPKGHEQQRLNFDRLLPTLEPVMLFDQMVGLSSAASSLPSIVVDHERTSDREETGYRNRPPPASQEFVADMIEESPRRNPGRPKGSTKQEISAADKSKPPIKEVPSTGTSVEGSVEG